MIDADTQFIPFIQPVNTLLNLNPVMPSQLMQLGDIRQFPQRAVRFRGIPSQFSLETNLTDNHLRSLPYAHFLSRSHIDVTVPDVPVTFAVRILEVHIQQHMHTRIRHFLAPQKLPHRRSRAP